jgi:DNA-binding CsgD family transcriptional regulator
MVDTVPQTRIAGLHERIIDFASRVDELCTPSDVLDALHDITIKSVQLRVLGAARIPPKSTTWDSMQLSKSVFLHKDVPKGWWKEYETLGRGKFRPLLFLAQSSMAPCTWAEAKQVFEPIGADRWSEELFLKYGIRDGFCCPVGRWVVVFWSRKDLSKSLTPRTRKLLFAAAAFSALRLEQLTHANLNQVGSPTRLTPRELAVLRLVSTGAPHREIAKALEIGEETVRTHLKKAQMKLGVRNRTHAVVEALRQNLIP